MTQLPKSRVAAVQAAPVFLNLDATTDKACALIAQAAGNGAELVAFPEVFLPGYPYWNWLLNPIEGSAWFERLWHASVDLNGPQVERICKTARENNCIVVIGVNERDPKKVGTIYNTNVIIGDDGTVLGRHRKLVPTWAEKLTWTGGDGSSLNVYPTKVGPLGTLACGENTNTLARFALLSEGELVHVANYIALPVAPADYDMAQAIRIRAAAHSFEGKLFTLVSCSAVSEEIIEAISQGDPKKRELMSRKNSAFTGIIDPSGNVIGEPLIDEEGIAYADIDLGKCVAPKQMHDIIGGYNRFDIFDLKVDRSPREPVDFDDGVTAEVPEDTGE